MSVAYLSRRQGNEPVKGSQSLFQSEWRRCRQSDRAVNADSRRFAGKQNTAGTVKDAQLVGGMTRGEIYLQYQPLSQVKRHLIRGGDNPVCRHRLNFAVSRRQIAQSLPTRLPQPGGVNQVVTGSWMRHDPGITHVLDCRADATGMVNMNMRQDDVINPGGADAEAIQRREQTRDGGSGPGLHKGFLLTAEQVRAQKAVIPRYGNFKLNKLELRCNAVYSDTCPPRLSRNTPVAILNLR